MHPTLSIMSYNIRGAHFDDGANRWPHRKPINLNLLQNRAPDLIGLQEIHQENLEILSPCGYAHVKGTPYNDHPPYQYTTIAWDPHKLQRVESGGFWLSETPDRHSRSWDTACIRSATWVKLTWLETGLAFLHLNTHLDHISEMARVEGAKVIIEFLNKVHLPVVVSGDMNCPPNSETYQLFMANQFIDSYIESGNTAVRWTYHGYKGTAYIPHQQDHDRIDWILLRDWKQNGMIQSCSIIEDSQPPLYPSDHYPIVTQIATE